MTHFFDPAADGYLAGCSSETTNDGQQIMVQATLTTVQVTLKTEIGPHEYVEYDLSCDCVVSPSYRATRSLPPEDGEFAVESISIDEAAVYVGGYGLPLDLAQDNQSGFRRNLLIENREEIQELARKKFNGSQAHDE